MADLISAAKDGDTSRVLRLLNNGADPNVQNERLETPIFWAACCGHANICYLLIQRGAKVDAANEFQLTPLHGAADTGHSACMRILVGSGASPNVRNNNRSTPLHLAAYRGYVDACMLLLDAGASLGALNSNGKSCVQEAESQGHHGVVREFGKWLQGHLHILRKGSPSEAEHLHSGSRDMYAHLTTTFTEPIRRSDSSLHNYRNFQLAIPGKRPAAGNSSRVPCEQSDISPNQLVARSASSLDADAGDAVGSPSSTRPQIPGEKHPTDVSQVSACNTGTMTPSGGNSAYPRGEAGTGTRDSSERVELEQAKHNLSKLSKRVYALEDYIEQLQLELVKWMEKSGELEKENAHLRLSLLREKTAT